MYYTNADHSNLWTPFSHSDISNNTDFIQLKLDLRPKKLIIPDVYTLWLNETRCVSTCSDYEEMFNNACRRYEIDLSTLVTILYGFRSQDHARVLRYFNPLCWVVWEYGFESVTMCTITGNFSLKPENAL